MGATLQANKTRTARPCGSPPKMKNAPERGVWLLANAVRVQSGITTVLLLKVI